MKTTLLALVASIGLAFVAPSLSLADVNVNHADKKVTTPKIKTPKVKLAHGKMAPKVKLAHGKILAKKNVHGKILTDKHSTKHS